MTVQRQGMSIWSSCDTVEAECKGANVEILLVDVGGGISHQSIALKQAFPHRSGQIVLQDLPEVPQHATSVQGVEPMAHDMFSPQTSRGKLFEWFLGVQSHLIQEQKITTCVKYYAITQIGGVEISFATRSMP